MSLMNWRHLAEIQTAAREIGLDSVNLCVSTKANAGIGGFYLSRHELIFVSKNGNVPHINNVGLGPHRRNRSDVWAYASGPGFSSIGEED
jgi:hypothetical protein